MPSLVLLQTQHPQFSSEPSVTEYGYRTRYNVQASYAEVKPQTLFTPANLYEFQPTTIGPCKEKQDFVALLCMGTTKQTFPAKYFDRTKLLTSNIDVVFEGQVSYTYSGGTVQRGGIKFFNARPTRVFPFVTTYLPGAFSGAGPYTFTHTLQASTVRVEIQIQAAGGNSAKIPLSVSNLHRVQSGATSGAYIFADLTAAQYGAGPRTVSVGSSPDSPTTSSTNAQLSSVSGIGIANGGAAGNIGAVFPNSLATGTSSAGATFTISAPGAWTVTGTLGTPGSTSTATYLSAGSPAWTFSGSNGGASIFGVGGVAPATTIIGPIASSPSNFNANVRGLNYGSGAAGGAVYRDGAEVPNVPGGDGVVIFREFSA